ncbi:hypothetical protein JOB18_014156 [Solea senegalensis]|uniref:Uncharacterized protein n=1 Tax=Solea senegalensis TaxID=28829 RepID=A0AAV6PDM1_SOLSE|nr:hypothetical protein JOB18_014156 [Solea senegalensis]
MELEFKHCSLQQHMKHCYLESSRRVARQSSLAKKFSRQTLYVVLSTSSQCTCKKHCRGDTSRSLFLAAAETGQYSQEKQQQQRDAEAQNQPQNKVQLHVILFTSLWRGDRDFTPAAAQVAHQKPQPGVPKLPSAQHINQHIHQPRK